MLILFLADQFTVP